VSRKKPAWKKRWLRCCPSLARDPQVEDLVRWDSYESLKALVGMATD